MGLTQLENVHDQLLESFGILADFRNNLIFVDQMVEQQRFRLISKFGIDLRGCVHDTEEHQFVDGKHDVRISNSSLNIKTVIYSFTQR